MNVRMWIYTHVVWVWMVLACVVAYNLDNIPMIYEYFEVFAGLYIAGCLILFRVQSKDNNVVK
ncbi:hypothetical protein GQ473_00350 [archaeon]|nr:hypothetical protein [archaeon]